MPLRPRCQKHNEELPVRLRERLIEMKIVDGDAPQDLHVCLLSHNTQSLLRRNIFAAKVVLDEWHSGMLFERDGARQPDHDAIMRQPRKRGVRRMHMPKRWPIDRRDHAAFAPAYLIIELPYFAHSRSIALFIFSSSASS